MKTSTIAAIATPRGSGGIGIVKLSGPDALRIATQVFKKSDGNTDPLDLIFSALPANSDSGIDDIKHRASSQILYGHIIDNDRKPIDEVLLIIMKAPHSHTREDVVEIQAHSGSMVLRTILDLVLSHGAELAAPGEFTRRAFLNGRIDLTQAEAVIDIINSDSRSFLDLSANMIQGNLKMRVSDIREALIDIQAEVEASIDFPEELEDEETTHPDNDHEKYSALIESSILKPIKELISNYDNSHIIREGISLVIIGRPNVGKSSLMNCLVSKDRVIVTDVPGTTRDVIEETLNIKGLPVVIADTAGLHDTDDPVELIGIQRADAYIENADIILFMVDASCELTDNDLRILDKISDRRTIIVSNKSDLISAGFTQEVPDNWKDYININISALHHHGIEELTNHVYREMTVEYNLESPDTIVPNLRQNLLLKKACNSAYSMTKNFSNKAPGELIAIDINDCMEALDEILGILIKEDVLDQIFSRFCIGK